MSTRPIHPLVALSLVALAACGGSGGGGGGGGSSDPAIEVESDDYPALSDRAAVGGPATVTLVLLENGVSQSVTTAGFDQSTGEITSGDLNGADIDEAAFTNPANGEVSRVVTVSGADSYFGVVGFVTEAADRPDMGTTTYNEGWAGLTATTDAGTYSLEGDVTLTATWDGSNRVDGTFSDLSGTLSGTGGVDQSVNDVGDISLSDSTISGSTFSGGDVTGTGIFAPLDGASSTSGTRGAFFGAEADEIGGVLVITDDDVNVIGAFQAD